MPRFKLYVSNNLLLKEEFDVYEAKLPKVQSNEDDVNGEDEEAKISEDQEYVAENFFEAQYRVSSEQVGVF